MCLGRCGVLIAAASSWNRREFPSIPSAASLGAAQQAADLRAGEGLGDGTAAGTALA